MSLAEKQLTKVSRKGGKMLLRLFCESCAAEMKNQLMKGVRLRLSLLFLFLLFLQSFLIIGNNMNHDKNLNIYCGKYAIYGNCTSQKKGTMTYW